MPKQSTIVVKEDLDQLNNLYKKETNHRIRCRIKCLICTKKKDFSSQKKLSIHLGVDYATIKRWLKQYKEEGITSLLNLKSGGARRSCINEDIHNALSEKLKDSGNPLLGYWDAVLWVKKKHGLEIKYNTLRTYLIRHFKTKLKEPRKSHYKKDEEAIQAFKKIPK
jgi:transposase